MAGEQSAQVAGGQGRARREVKGKGRVKSGEGGQADRAKGGRGRGTSRAGGAGDPGGPAGSVGLAGSEVKRGPAGERWEPGRVRAQSGGLLKAGVDGSR